MTRAKLKLFQRIADLHMCTPADRVEFDTLSSTDFLGVLQSLNSDKQHIRLLDVGCGQGTVPEALVAPDRFGGNRRPEWAAHVDYTGVDVSEELVDNLGLMAKAMWDGKFAGFNTRRLDLLLDSDFELFGSPFDVVCSHFVLHAIPPGCAAKFLGRLCQLAGGAGRVHVVDMEDFPSGKREAFAVAWNRSEVADILRAGGIAVNGFAAKSLGGKSGTSLLTFVVTGSDRFDFERANEVERRLLQGKLRTAIGAAHRLTPGAALPNDEERFLEYLEHASRCIHIARATACG